MHTTALITHNTREERSRNQLTNNYRGVILWGHMAIISFQNGHSQRSDNSFICFTTSMLCGFIQLVARVVLNKTVKRQLNGGAI